MIYAAAGKDDAPEKRRRANELILSADFAISTQVLQEFYWNVTRKPAVPLTPAEALDWIDQLVQLPVVTIDTDLIEAGILASLRFRISYWDAAIIVAAERAQAVTVYSEDLNDGQVYGSVRVENPFR